MTKQAGTLYTDERGNEYKKVAENKDYFFLAPFSVEEDGGKRVDKIGRASCMERV